MSRLVKYFSEHNQDFLNQRVQGLIEIFERYVDSQEWYPKDSHWGNLTRVVELGSLASNLSGDSEAVLKLKNEIEKFVRGERPDLPTLSELHCAALLNSVGWNPKFVPETSFKTPDLRVDCEGLRADIEVVRCDQKVSQNELMRKLDIFAQAVDYPEAGNLAIYCDVEFSEKVQSEILDAISQIHMGETIEITGSWCVVSGSPENREKFISGQVKPNWLQKGSRVGVARMLLPGANSIRDVPPPTLKVDALILDQDYMNPIRRKADRPQGDTSRPYIIAADVTNLPLKAEKLEMKIKPYWGIWDHVSAILLFHLVRDFNAEFSWWAVFLQNPFALRQVDPPDGLADGSTAFQTIRPI